MKLTRRDAMAMGLGATMVAMLPLRVSAEADDAIMAYTGGVEPGEGDITFTAPEIAENGNTVPVSVAAPGAAEIMIIATANPSPDVALFKFGPLAGEQSASTRIRMAGTQDLIAIAKMPDGSFIKASQNVKVTIGGCGG